MQAFIVDDREVDRYTARRRLAKTGRFAEVHEAEDGRVFLRQLADTDTSQRAMAGPLILMDISMPHMDGFETVEALREQMFREGWPKESVTVVMVSSSSAPSDKARASDTDLINAYFEKPICVADVERMIALVEQRGAACE